jgi:hypothetical protein
MNNIKGFHGVGTENHRSWEVARIFAYIESKAERTHRRVNDPYPLGIFETDTIEEAVKLRSKTGQFPKGVQRALPRKTARLPKGISEDILKI